MWSMAGGARGLNHSFVNQFRVETSVMCYTHSKPKMASSPDVICEDLYSK